MLIREVFLKLIENADKNELSALVSGQVKHTKNGHKVVHFLRKRNVLNDVCKKCI
jgi:hypothetical protein